jgi:Mlc titration factor MtfA (ptsG expression regulator)
VVYPAGFLARGRYVDEAGVVHEYAEDRAGEAWLQGPVILSFEDIRASRERDGHNVVLHEMAHKLDMLDGDANGRPPLHPGMDPKRWYEDFSAAFESLNRCLDAGEAPPINAYAAESPGEFFAVASEYFFELPQVLGAAYPAVHAQLEAFYHPR